MKKTLLISLLMAVLAPFAMNAQEKGMWDLVKQFQATTGRQQNIATDGQYIYTAVFEKKPENNPPVNSMFYKYDWDGNLIEEFDVAGCETLRDMTYDGQYFYGGSSVSGHDNRLYCVDLANKTAHGYVEIASSDPDFSIRHCSYDPVNDGFWLGRSSNLMLVNRSGQVIQTVSGVPASGIYCSGSGYFTDADGEAHLYMFCNQGITPYVYDYNITTDYFETTPMIDFSQTPGYVAYGGAGGACVGQYDGHTCFFGSSPASPRSFIAIYHLEDGDTPTPPTPPTPPTGDVFYDFEDNIMSWTTIDADGDGYNWHLNRNWGGDENNLYSLQSWSVDNELGIALTPDNYMVAPFQLDYEQITFIACTQDIYYPSEHIGVAVSTTVNDDPSEFSTIWETTLTAKTGDWYWFSVDLRDYQGQNIWVAIRHFFSTDQLAVNVDDITLHRVYDAVNEPTIDMVSVYPNPTSDVVMINSTNNVEYYEIYNTTGAMIRREDVDATSFSIDMRELPAGVYFLKMNGETKRIVKK